MTCPPILANTLLAILTEGLLRCRQAGWANDPGRCAVEADHLHNLPSLLREYSPDLLRYYWDVERPAYIRAVDASGIGTAGFEHLWEQLREHVERGPIVA